MEKTQQKRCNLKFRVLYIWIIVKILNKSVFRIFILIIKLYLFNYQWQFSKLCIQVHRSLWINYAVTISFNFISIHHLWVWPWDLKLCLSVYLSSGMNTYIYLMWYSNIITSARCGFILNKLIWIELIEFEWKQLKVWI